MNELIKINPDGKTTARELYEFLQLDPSNYSKWCRVNVLENEFAEENSDWGLLVQQEEYSGRGQRAANYWLSIPFAKKLCMMSKSERGNQARDYFIEVERQLHESSVNLPAMTQTQLIAAIAQNQADQEQKMLALTKRADKVEHRLELVKDTFTKRDNDKWRENIVSDINAIAKAREIGYREVWTESYQLLEERGHYDIPKRLRNAKDRMYSAGATKTAVEKLNRLDVIEQEPRIREIYTVIIKEMKIKYVA